MENNNQEKSSFAKASEDKLEKIRHSLSHLMTMAVLEVYPGAGLGVGPVIENGFYQDYDLSDKISEDDLPKLEARMRELIKEKIDFVQSSVSFAEALEYYKNDPYKSEMIKELEAKGEKEVNFYTSGSLRNLCAGPHVNNTSEINPDAFKLTKLAGAYWRGDEKNKMLTRIYGVAFESKEELENYLHLLEEAEKRDHRKLGKELDLFSMHEEAPGMPFFHPKGAIIYSELKKFWLEAQEEFDYDTVLCPSMLDISMWKRSGHWDHYKDDMYFINADEDGRQFALRPMDCPGAILIYNNSLKSYRDLPLRFAEPGLITRKEKSGQLGGLLRVQQFTQDDAHMFITEDQVKDEIMGVIKLVDKMYKPFGLEYKAFLSTRPDDYMGDIKVWDKAEAELKEILTEVYGDSYGLKDKDGAFYGPKIDYQLKDCLGRTWQCATIQLDFQMPLKFDCKYIDRDGKEKPPVMIHRTIMGSFERFMGILIEHYAGAFPVWLSPVQVKILSVGEAHIDFCQKLKQEFKDNNIRAEVDESSETVGNKIRKATGEKAPYVLVVGDKEIESGQLAVRDRGAKDTRLLGKEEFIAEVIEKIASRS